MDLSVATVGSSAETDVGAEHKAQSVPSTAHHNSTVGQQSSAPVRFKIRTAQERALLKQAGSQQGQNELHKLSILREGKSVNAKGEECQMKQAENPTVKGADEVSVVSATDVNDTLTGIKPNSRSNKLETQNQDKLTEIPKPVNGKTKPDSRTSQLQSDSRGSSSHTGYSENWAVYRGRPQWRRVNAPSRSKSLDWREESRTDAGKLQVQNFLESHVGRRAESLERGGRSVVDRAASAVEKMNPTPNAVMSMVKMYNSSDRAEEKTLLGECSDVNAGPEIQPLRSNSSLSVKKGNSCQSLPSRLKSNQGGASEDRYAWKCNPYDPVSNPRLKFGSGTTEPSNSARTAGGVFANQSILNRIEKLYGSSNSDAGLNNNEAKKNCDGARDCEIDNRQHLWHSDTWRKSVHDVQWRSMTHKGQNGGTFPRRSSEGNNFKSNFGTTFRGFGNEKGEQKLPISTQGNFSVFEQSKEASSAECRTSLRDIEGDVRKQPQLTSDTTRNRISMPEQQRSLRAEPGNSHAVLLRDPSLPSNLVRDKEDRGREVEKEDREQDCEMQREEKEGDKVQRMVRNGEKDTEAEEWMQAKPLKVITDNDRSPTVIFSATMDSLVLTSPSISQVAFSTAGKVKEEPKEGMEDHPDGKMECIPPLSKSLRKEDKDVSMECGPAKDQETKLNSANSGDNLSSDTVRNKIHRFEALALRSQASQLPSLWSRRALSLQEQPRDLVGQMMRKSGLHKPLGGVKEKDVQGKEVIQKNVLQKDEGESRWLLRSFSVVDAGQSRDGRYKDFWDSDNTFKTQSNRSEKTSLQTTITQTRPHESWKSNSAESSSFTVSHPDVKKAVISQEISHPSEIHTPYQQTNCTNSGTSGVGEEDITTRSVHDSANTSCIGMDKAVCSSSNNDKAGGAKSNCASEREAQVSENAKNPSGPVSLAKPLLSSADDTVGVLNPSGSQCEPSRVLSQQSSGSSNNPQRHGDAAPVDKDGSIGSFDVCTARSGSEAEDLEDEDDDDDNSTEKGNDSNYDSDSGESSVTITSNMSQCDHRSFSATLADLCNFGGVEYASRDDLDEDSEDCASHRTASLSSDISAFSSVSLLATEELDRLISDVRNLGDESLQSYEDVQVVVLHKEVGCGLGFTVAGGMDQNKAITVHKVFPGGLAAQEGSIQEGDEVLSINGTALQNCAHWEALRTLRRARARGMAVVVLQKGTVKQLQKAQGNHTVGTSDLDSKVNEGRILRVMLNKSSTDLGFSLEGGLDSSVGDRSITVKKVFHGGPVSEVSSGDELLEIAGHNLHGLRRLEVWSLIKKLPPGPVEVVLNRPFKGKRERMQKAPQL
ncbi:uncharacterized protein LOC108923879 [Scleropages formosus]|uniref:uncharacterized protein LOC108923879 n=1 Tax=Scleropages formosus TaxID=113540 RepID=UPI0008790598|nr:uncharacterized protein LOC108923879 [Scleropages formosus]XP_029101811.1 uncharacterized protein LOC108923879 [Scleropages formosus]